MQILAHRGLWVTTSEKNSEAAFRRAFGEGFGVETDLRDHGGSIVVSHDIPDDRAMSLVTFLELYSSYGSRPILALNVKSDGLQALIAEALARYEVANYFVFDMSVPDTLGYLARRLRTFLRRSEFELGSPLDARADGVWLDALEESWVPSSVVRAELTQGRYVGLVSPELHGKPHDHAWAEWRDVLDVHPMLGAKLILCTDFPRDAAAFFGTFVCK
jgi:hypothetical protein